MRASGEEQGAEVAADGVNWWQQLRLNWEVTTTRMGPRGKGGQKFPGRGWRRWGDAN